MSDETPELESNLVIEDEADALDHDNDGKKGGSLKGAASTRAKGAAKKKAEGMPGKTWIILEENDDIPPTGLPISHNGNPYLIRAGEPVEVPDFLLNILDDAVTSVPVFDPTTRRVIDHRPRMRFPYRRVAAPAGAE